MSNAINSLKTVDISKTSIESLILNTLCRVDKAIICFLKTPVFRIRNRLSSILRMEREKETDILITSLALCKPATQQEITVITADQHVCFLRIDAGNHTCAVNIWWENPAVCFETKNSVWRAMGVWWQWKLCLIWVHAQRPGSLLFCLVIVNLSIWLTDVLHKRNFFRLACTF